VSANSSGRFPLGAPAEVASVPAGALLAFWELFSGAGLGRPIAGPLGAHLQTGALQPREIALVETGPAADELEGLGLGE
jgi:hypothetical protein